MRKLLCLAVLTLSAALGLAAGGPAASAAGAAPAACTGTVQITGMSFSPPSVTAGQGSTVTLVTQNCTSQTQVTSEIWSAQFLNFGTIPGSCVAIDPVPIGRTYQPNQTATRMTGYSTFAGCTATILRVTVRITNSADGSLLATQTADLQIGTQPACSGVVQITGMTFSPPSVAPGQSSTLTAAAQNCTDQTQATSETWFGQFIGSGTGIPAGCAAIDPIAIGASFPPNGAVSKSVGYLVFGGCTASLLRVTVRITGSDGTLLATQSADLPILSQSTCRVSYQLQSEWMGGFVASVTVANTSAVPVSGWSVAFTFGGDQQIGQAWNAQIRQVGPAVTATDLGYNRTIAAGSSLTFGFVGSWHASDAPPASFTLNGTACVTG